MSTTPNINLSLTPENNTTTTFKQWRVAMNGESNSNMTKIDEAIGGLTDDCDQLQSKVDTVSAKVFGESPRTWEDVQTIVRNGAAPQYFDVGDQFTVEKLSAIVGSIGDSTGITAVSIDNADFLEKIGETKAGVYTFTYDGHAWRDDAGAVVNLVDYGVTLTGAPTVGDTAIVTETTAQYTFDVLDFDHDVPTNNQYTHSMTLQLHDLWGSYMQYDAREALYYAADGLEAGIYCFTVAEQEWFTADNGKTYQFTLTQAVPAGGQIVLEMTYNQTLEGKSVKTYENSTSTTVIETAALTEGSTGTNLGTTNGNSTNVNHMHKAIFGSNRWTHSALRQWMNSDAAGNAWWTPQNNFDRPSSNAASAGFLKDMDAAFLNVVGYVNKTTQKSVVDGHGLESTSERFFLPSRPEMYMGTERSTDGPDGTVYAYYGAGYSDLTAPGSGADTHRIKYNGGTAYYWWMRTPYSGGGYSVRIVYADGSLSGVYANLSFGVAPACAIV